MSTVYFDKRSRLLVMDCLDLEGHSLRYSCAPYLRVEDRPQIESFALPTDGSPPQEVHLLCRRLKAEGVLFLNLLQRFGLPRSRTILHDLRALMGSEPPVFLGGAVEVLCGQLLAPPLQGGVPVLDNLEAFAGTQVLSRVPRLGLAGDAGADRPDTKELALVLGALACDSEIDVLLPGVSASGATGWGSGWSLTVPPDDAAAAALSERMRGLHCDHLALVGAITASAPWTDYDRFLRWLESVHEGHPAAKISLRGRFPWWDENCLEDMHRCGVVQCEIPVSSRSLREPLPSRQIRARVRMCLDHQIRPGISGEILTPEASWPEVHRLWTVCEEIGVDFLRVLAGVAESAEPGWCADVCRTLSQGPSVFFAYELADRHVRLARQGMSCYRDLHSSLASLCSVRFGQVRETLAGEIAAYGVLRPGRDKIERAAQAARGGTGGYRPYPSGTGGSSDGAAACVPERVGGSRGRYRAGGER